MTVAVAIASGQKSCKPVEALMHRIIGDRSVEFQTALIATDEQLEQFEISGGGGQPVTLKGNSPSALSRAFNHYLKFCCGCAVSWCGSRIALPDPLPRVAPAIRVSTPFSYRYYFNYCTFSYSMAFWDWARWEKEIDWMALAGINLPLAITGQEAVWQRVYSKMGLTDAEIKAFLAGPAFLAWGWMGNLDGWGGPTTQSWIDAQSQLQIKILARQRELGMKPVLPAFSGHVPPALSRKFPSANIRQLHNWAENFTGTFLLEATDPMFQEIGHAFIHEQTALYGIDTWGTEHFYSCDTFNENTPPNNDPAYLTNMSKCLYQGMAGADDRAVWVMQAWMFHFNPDDPGFWKTPQICALLDAVPNDHMVVLDLHAEAFPLWKSTEAFHGKPWIWCFLHNFGGHRSIYGNLDRLATDLSATLQDKNRGQLVGMGLTPEGIENNPVMYDLATDLMWRKNAVDAGRWLTDYATRRYGKTTPAIENAWDILRKTVYARSPEAGGTVCTMLNLSPRLGSERATLNYAAQDLIPALESLASAASQFKPVDPFCYDLVDLSRQVLANFATHLHGNAIAAYFRKDAAALTRHAAAFLELIDDVDALLATRHEFLLGAWLASAKAGNLSEDDRRLREWNARTQVTMWGNAQSMLRDYARKEWAGLLKDFYRYRWSAFFDQLADCLKTSKPLDEKSFQQRLRAWEVEWALRTDVFADQPVGDSTATALTLLDKYRPIMAREYQPTPSLTTGRRASASAGTSKIHLPQHAVTGIASRTSFWSADPTPQWLMIDLESEAFVSRVHAFFYWDGVRCYRYRIETSTDGADWTVAVNATENTTPASPDGERHEFAGRYARFIRLHMVGNSANEAVHVLDFRAFAGPESQHQGV
jgi:alpha-N-acetylglucosaminidase